MDNCEICNQILDGLHIGEIDEKLCIICEHEIVSLAETEYTTLLLWKGSLS